MKKNEYFRLYSECKLITGKSHGVIYNLLSGDMFSLKPEKLKIIALSESNKPISEISQLCGLPTGEVQNFLLEVEESNLGTFFPKPVFIDEYIDRNLQKVEGIMKDPPVLQMAFIELSNRCDLNCFFCTEQPLIRRLGCLGCYRNPLNGKEPISEEHYMEVLSQLNKLRCINLIMGGGNPLMETEKFIHIVKEARTMHFKEIFVVTNGIYMGIDMIRFLKEYNIHPIIPVTSEKAEIFDANCGQKEGFIKLISNLEQLKKLDMPFSFTLVFTHVRKEETEEIKKYYQAFAPQNMFGDLFIPLNKVDQFGTESREIEKQFFYQNRVLPAIKMKEFYDKLQFNPCLNGKLAITSAGDILPCPEMRNEVLGNIKTKSILEIFADEALEPYWKLSKEKVEKCKDCERRYACSDCRAMEKNATNDLYGMKYCAYDPEKGEWLDIQE